MNTLLSKGELAFKLLRGVTNEGMNHLPYKIREQEGKIQKIFHSKTTTGNVEGD